jgi:hypothetical protein
MSYFHVIAKLNSNKDQSCIFSDLSSKELNKKFIKPYEKGLDFLSQNTVVRVSELEAIHIIETENNIDIELKVIQLKSREKIDRINRESNVKFLSIGRGYGQEDIIEAGTDVTQTYIKGPPGYSKITLPNFLGGSLLKWFSGIFGGLVVAFIAKWLGLV